MNSYLFQVVEPDSLEKIVNTHAAIACLNSRVVLWMVFVNKDVFQAGKDYFVHKV